MNKIKNTGQHRKLALKKDTVVCLTDDLLKRVVGGDCIGGDDDVTNSNPISRCNTQCVGRF